MLSRSIGMPSRKNGPPSIWDTHGKSGNVFVNPDASSSLPYLEELNPWSSHKTEPIHSPQTEKNENQTPVQDQRCQSGPSAKSSVIPSEGDYSKNYGADPQRLQISDLRFDKFPTPATFPCWNIRFKTEVFTCSQFPTEAMLASRKKSVWRNKKLTKKTVSFAEDRSLTWSTNISGSLEPTIPSRIMPTYSLLLFEMMIFRDSIQNGTEFCYQWRKSHLMISWKDCTN